jgi:periplasmic protein TonB
MGVDLTAPRAMPGAPLDGAPSPGTTGLAPVPTRPPVPRAVEAPGTPSAAMEAPRPSAAPPMPGLADVPAESTASSAPATERPLPLPRMAAASPPLPSPPAPPSTDPGPRGPAVEAGTSVPRSVTPVPSTRSPSSDPEGRQQAASESSAAGSSASPGPGTAEPGDAASRGWSARGDGAGPARGGRPGAVDGANLVRLSPGEGQAGSAAGGAIPPEYEAYVRALRQRVQDRLVYPWMAVRHGQQGVVELEVHLGADGRLVAVEVVAGVSADTLRGAAMAAVRGSAPFPFPPGLAPRPLVVRLPVEFRLR